MNCYVMMYSQESAYVGTASGGTNGEDCALATLEFAKSQKFAQSLLDLLQVCG